MELHSEAARKAIVGMGAPGSEATCPRRPERTRVTAYSTHKWPRIRRWLAGRPRFRLHFTPTYSSWLNQVERWFAELTTRQLRRGVHRSIASLERAIREFLEAYDADARPFAWTKTADEILDRIGRFAQRTLAAHGG